MAMLSEIRPRVCLIEDDEIMGESLAQRFQLEGFDVDWWRTAHEAGAALESRRYGVVVSDIRLPDRNGGDLFLDLSARLPMLPPFLFMTAFGSIDRAVELLKAGAADYIAKPFEADLLVDKVRGLVKGYGAISSDGCDGDALGVSPIMRRIAESLPRLSRHATALLVTGDSGVGKEHVAKLFHRQGAGDSAPFIAVNCAAIPESLLEAELFGYEKGAFTGAVKAKRGGASSRPAAVRCSSTKSEKCRCRCKPSCCACCRNGRWFGSAAKCRWSSISGWSAPPTRT